MTDWHTRCRVVAILVPIRNSSWLPVSPVGGFHRVDEVDVGHVIEFLRSELAHADDGETHMFAAFDLMAGDGQRALQRAVRQIGQFTADGGLDDARIGGRGILRHDRREMTVVRATQCRGRIGEFHGGHGCIRFVGIGADRCEHGCAALRMVVQVGVVRVGGRRLDEIGMEAHELAHRVGDAEHGDQLSERRVVGA